ncbi:MAG: DUF998 domain-containing protein [Theionarchaea archaeon]|nr:DUF998 domain-containing protein [Theionarchaea archaeon]
MNYENEKMAGALIFVAGVEFLLFLVIAESLYPDYSVSQNYISDLGVGSTALIFNASVFLLGLLLVAGTYFIHRAFNFKLLTVLLILAGSGAMGVGLFPEDAGFIHGIAALITFLFGGLSAIASSKLVKSPLSYFSVLLGVISLVALILFMTGTHLGLGLGGMERMVAYPTLLWGTGIGGYLMSYSK